MNAPSTILKENLRKKKQKRGLIRGLLSMMVIATLGMGIWGMQAEDDALDYRQIAENRIETETQPVAQVAKVEPVQEAVPPVEEKTPPQTTKVSKTPEPDPDAKVDFRPLKAELPALDQSQAIVEKRPEPKPQKQETTPPVKTRAVPPANPIAQNQSRSGQYKAMPDYQGKSLLFKLKLVGTKGYDPADKARLKGHIISLFEKGSAATVDEVYFETNGQEISKSFPLKLYLFRLEENGSSIQIRGVEEVAGNSGLAGVKIKV